jgi:2-C-methyl-D-erythritol 2,4-cyclodiphosphate synthase
MGSTEDEQLVIVRVGQGFDIHRFEDAPTPGRELILGGQRFPGERALAGHSDADVIAHAVADALLGAAGLGDIGQHFPDTNPQWKNADSIEILRAVGAMLVRDGWSVGNVDCSVVCERPKLAPVRDAMQSTLSRAAGGQVTVKGRRAEGLGAIGRAEGIMCFASAVITREESSKKEVG